VVTGGYAPEFVNVQAQRKDPESLLNFVRLLADRYRACPELGWGRFTALEQPNAAVVAHRATWDDASLVALHNLGPDPATVPLALDDAGEGWHLDDLLFDGSTPLDDEGRCEIALEGYGYRWLRVVRPGDRRLR
jgi:hypothetical protein